MLQRGVSISSYRETTRTRECIDLSYVFPAFLTRGITDQLPSVASLTYPVSHFDAASAFLQDVRHIKLGHLVPHDRSEQ